MPLFKVYHFMESFLQLFPFIRTRALSGLVYMQGLVHFDLNHAVFRHAGLAWIPRLLVVIQQPHVKR